MGMSLLRTPGGGGNHSGPGFDSSSPSSSYRHALSSSSITAVPSSVSGLRSSKMVSPMFGFGTGTGGGGVDLGSFGGMGASPTLYRAAATAARRGGGGGRSSAQRNNGGGGGWNAGMAEPSSPLERKSTLLFPHHQALVPPPPVVELKMMSTPSRKRGRDSAGSRGRVVSVEGEEEEELGQGQEVGDLLAQYANARAGMTTPPPPAAAIPLGPPSSSSSALRTSERKAAAGMHRGAGGAKVRTSTGRKIAGFRHGFSSSDEEEEEHGHQPRSGVSGAPPLPSSSTTASMMMPPSDMDDVFSTPSRMLHHGAGWGHSQSQGQGRQRNVSGGGGPGTGFMGLPQTPSRFGTPLIGSGVGGEGRVTPHGSNHQRQRSGNGRNGAGAGAGAGEGRGGSPPRTPRSDAMTLTLTHGSGAGSAGGGGGGTGSEMVSPCLSRSMMRGSLGMGLEGGRDRDRDREHSLGHPASISALLESPTGGLGFGGGYSRPGSSGGPRRSNGSAVMGAGAGGVDSWKFAGAGMGIGLGTPGSWGGQALKVRQVSAGGMSNVSFGGGSGALGGGAGAGVGVGDAHLGLGIGFDFDDVLDLC
ncbi:unnamed protein product [Tilletia caries]|nr:unnamed protein product [Tilletia caries]